MDSLRDIQPGNPVKGQVQWQVLRQVQTLVGDQIRWRVAGPIWRKIWIRVAEQVWGQVKNQVQDG
jgi:hypothetical protein